MSINKFKILSINEWKESDNYMIHKFFKSKKKYFKKLFESNELYKDLELDRFDYDTSAISDEVRFGYLFFSDKEFDYKLTLIIDYELLKGEQTPETEEIEEVENEEESEEIDNEEDLTPEFIITEVEYKLSGNKIGDLEDYDVVNTKINEDELTDDFIITLISEFKEKNEID